MDFSMILSSGLVCTFITIFFTIFFTIFYERYNDVCRIKSLVAEIKEILRRHRQIKDALSGGDSPFDKITSGKLLIGLLESVEHFKLSGVDKISFYRRFSRDDFDMLTNHFIRVQGLYGTINVSRILSSNTNEAATRFIEINSDKDVLEAAFRLLDDTENLIEYYVSRNTLRLFLSSRRQHNIWLDKLKWI